MYCPKCSQPQTSDEMRYCSRCGFPLATVAVLLDNNGNLPDACARVDRKHSSRGWMASESLTLMLLAWGAGILLTFLFNWGGPFELLAKLGAVLFFTVGMIGLLRFLYAFLLVRDSAEQARDSELNATASRPSLSAPQPNPVTDWQRPPVNTREMIGRPSVTENTTQLLEETEQPQ